MPVNSMPLLREPAQEQRAGRVEPHQSAQIERAGLALLRPMPEGFSASPSVRMSSEPRSAARSPSSPTSTVKADGVADSGSMLAGTLSTTRQLPDALTWLDKVPFHFFVIPGAGPPVDGTGAEL